MSSIAILGRQPQIGFAELESLFGKDVIRFVNDYVALLDISTPDVPFLRLGGTIKLADCLAKSDKNNLKTDLIKTFDQLKLSEKGKINIGISVYGLSMHVADINKLAYELKKHLTKQGYSARTVPNRENALNTAQVWHNKLLGNHGFELLLVAKDNQILIGRTTDIQDIKSYTMRDRYRPMRDAKVGMLPPKLAQIIINLANNGCDPAKQTVLDPFCGTGVILQEALLMGCKVVGTDIASKMIDYTTQNIAWLRQKFTSLGTSQILPGDAQTMVWDKSITTIASETYLGPVFYSEPKDSQLPGIITEINLLHKKFLQNLGQQLKAGTRLCLAIPAWKTKSGFKHLPLLDQLDELGYNRLAFEHADLSQLIYFRPDQFVARELVVLVRK
jgi:tRNA G10  N-methylase Trm11